MRKSPIKRLHLFSGILGQKRPKIVSRPYRGRLKCMLSEGQKAVYVHARRTYYVRTKNGRGPLGPWSGPALVRFSSYIE